MKDLFRRAGTVLRADVSLGPDNRSRGYGTVLLATAEDAGRVIDMFNGYTWQTRTLEVRPDRLGEESLAAGGVGTPVVGGLGGLTAPPSGSGTPVNVSSLPSPMGRYPSGLSVFSALEEAEAVSSRPDSSSGQASRNLFVGNVSALVLFACSCFTRKSYLS